MPRITANKYRVDATWDDAPHLTKEDKEALWDSIPAFQRDARAKGIPQLGAGAIWPILEDRVKCDPFPIPAYWPRAFALDVAWSCTAVIWGAWDRDSDCVYIWSEYKQGHAEPATHADAIKSRGTWIPGVIDPAARGRGQRDGVQLLGEYQKMDLDLCMADNSVEAGIHAVYRRLVSDRLKIFSTCVNFWDEFRLYRRDEKGKVVKDNDHLCDCIRYLIMSGMQIATTEIEYYDRIIDNEVRNAGSGSNRTTGY